MRQLYKFHDVVENAPYWADEDGNACDVLLNAKGEPEKIIKTEVDQEELLETFNELPVSTEFAAYGFDTKNLNGETNETILNQVLARLYPDGIVTLSRFLDAVRTAIDSGSFAKPKAVAPVARPRTDDGQFANAHWVEYQRMLNDPSVSSAEITRKLNSDKAFRDAVELGKRKEAGAPPAPSVFKNADNAEAVAFGRAYRRTANLHAVGGIHTLDYGNGERREFTVDAFKEHVEEAIACGAL